MAIGWWIAVLLLLTLLTFLLSLYEIYPETEGFRPIFTTPSYWLLLSGRVLVNWAAAFVLKVVLFPDIHPISLTIVTALASISIIENFAVKIADQKPVDVSAMLDSLKTTVIAEIGARKTTNERREIRRLVDELTETYSSNEQPLETEYKLLLFRVGYDSEGVQEQVDTLKQMAQTHDIPYARWLAQRIADSDVNRARDLLSQ